MGTIAVPTTECHGLAGTADGSIWIADPGRKEHLKSGVMQSSVSGGQVILVDARGRIRRTIQDPTTDWRPTDVSLHDLGRGSGGRLFVADGYGASVVHCFAADGTLLWTCDGSKTGTSFSTPHGIVVDTRTSPPRVLVADRDNRRIVSLTIDGDVLGWFGFEYLTSPSSLVIVDQTVWITELFGPLLAVSVSGELTKRIGTTDAQTEPAWPNRIVSNQITAPAEPGVFRSPHGIAAYPNGDLLVAEWVVGGRVTVFSP